MALMDGDARDRRRPHWVEEAWSLPADGPRPLQLFADRDWLRAWEHTTIERTLARAYLRHGEGTATTPYYCVESSPFWSAYETEAGVTAIWPGPVVYSPSLYAIHGGGLTDPAAIGRAVDLGLAQADAWGAGALAFVNIDGDEARRWARSRPPRAMILLDLAHRATLRATLDDQLAALRGHVRRELRRQWRRARERGVTLVELHGTAMRPWLAEFRRLASATAEQHSGDLYDLPTFEAVSGVPGAVLLVARHGDRMLGAFLAFGYERTLYLWTAGLDYGLLGDFGTYAFLMYESIDYAIREGHEVLELGRGNSSFKERHGFGATELWTLVYLTDRWAADRALDGRLAAMGRGLLEHLGVG